MSKMECPTCPKPKTIGFLIQIKGEQLSGIPAKFVAACFAGTARSKEQTSSSANWIVRSQLDGDAKTASLPLWLEDGIKISKYTNTRKGTSKAGEPKILFGFK